MPLYASHYVDHPILWDKTWSGSIHFLCNTSGKYLHICNTTGYVPNHILFPFYFQYIVQLPLQRAFCLWSMHTVAYCIITWGNLNTRPSGLSMSVCVVAPCSALLAHVGLCWQFRGSFEHIESVSEAVGKSYHSGCSANWISPWEEIQKKRGKVLFCTFLSFARHQCHLQLFVKHTFRRGKISESSVKKKNSVVYPQSRLKSTAPWWHEEVLLLKQLAISRLCGVLVVSFFFGPDTGDLRDITVSLCHH